MSRSIKLVKYWVRIRKIAGDNPDLSFAFIRQMLLSMAQVKTGDVTEYEFGLLQ